MPDFRSVGPPVSVFSVDEMVNRRVAGELSRAIRALDIGAVIRTDPAAHRLEIEPSCSDAEDIT